LFVFNESIYLHTNEISCISKPPSHKNKQTKKQKQKTKQNKQKKGNDVLCVQEIGKKEKSTTKVNQKLYGKNTSYKPIQWFVSFKQKKKQLLFVV